MRGNTVVLHINLSKSSSLVKSNQLRGLAGISGFTGEHFLVHFMLEGKSNPMAQRESKLMHIIEMDYASG